MPTVRQIEEALYAAAPRELAMSWDNVGLLEGAPDREVTRVLVSLDITQAVAEEAAAYGAELIVAHHPLMNCKWQPVQTLREDTLQGKLLRTLVRNDISAICMHTNLDIADGGVNDALAAAFGLEDPGPLNEEHLIRVGTIPGGAVPPEAFVARVSRALRCRGVRYVSGGKPVSRAAVGGGACADSWREVAAAGCDVFVTSDVKYHDFLDAAQAGLTLIDAGHFETEDPVSQVMIDVLREAFPKLEIKKSSHQGVIHYYTEGE